MGRIFTWEEVKDKKIPTLRDFSFVVKLIKQELSHCKGVLSAVLCGSVLWDSFTPRSDIDLVVVYDGKEKNKIINVLQRIVCQALCLYVPVEIIPIDYCILNSTFQPLDPSFILHLQLSLKKGGLIVGESLLFSLSPNKAAFEEDVYYYIRRKIHKLEKGITCFLVVEPYEFCRFIQKAAETPFHLVRKILCYQEIEMLQGGSKESVISLFSDFATQKEKELINRIFEIDKAYTRKLEQHLLVPRKVEYFKVIEELKTLPFIALEFFKIVSQRFF